MESKNISKELLNGGLERVQEIYDRKNQSPEIDDWDWSAGVITGGAAAITADKISEMPELGEFLAQQPHEVTLDMIYIGGGLATMAFAGSVSGGFNAYRDLAAQFNPVNVKEEYKIGKKNGETEPVIAEISQAWTPRNFSEAKDLLEDGELYTPTEDTLNYLGDAERAMAQKSSFGKLSRTQILEEEEIESFYKTIAETDNELREVIVEEPLDEDLYAFSAFWEEKRSMREDNLHHMFGYLKK